MNAIIHLQDGQIVGWLMGQDNHDLRRQLANMDDPSFRQIAQILYRMEYPRQGKHDLGEGYWLLVA